MSLYEIFAIVAVIIGIIGCVAPVIPGPIVTWVGLLLVYIDSLQPSGEPLKLSMLIGWFVVMMIITVLDYVVPAKFTQVTGGHKAGSVGGIAGMVVGIFFTPVGMLMGGFLGAFLCELIFSDSDIWGSLKAAAGVIVGFFVSTAMKLAVCILAAVRVLMYIF